MLVPCALFDTETADIFSLNPIALRKAKIVYTAGIRRKHTTIRFSLLLSERPKLYNFGLFECSGVKLIVVCFLLIIVVLKIVQFWPF